MATFFLRIRSRFSYKLNKISWELQLLEKQIQVFLIDVRFQSKLFLKNDIINLKSAVLAENDIF